VPFGRTMAYIEETAERISSVAEGKMAADWSEDSCAGGELSFEGREESEGMAAVTAKKKKKKNPRAELGRR